MVKRKRQTVEELLSELEKDPEYQQRRARKEEKLRQQRMKYEELERPVVEKLRAAGFAVASLDELVKRCSPLPADAVSILLEDIYPIVDVRHCEMLVRALAAAKAPFDGTPLAMCYESTSDESLRWAIANTIVLGHPHSLDDWIAKMPERSSLKCAFRNLGYSP